MGAVLLIDFGSTWTKLTAVDLEAERVLGTASAFTTAETDINEGRTKALAALERRIGVHKYDDTLACSSAAGGLRMMVSGLVPELTAEAAKLAALGAGAKVIRVFSHELTRRDLKDIEREKPDIFLLVGGTDGGNRSNIIGNAEKMAGLQARFPIILAGNRSAIDDCEEALREFPVKVCPNVMPTFGELQIEPVQEEIRNLFLSRIIEAKGLTEASALISDIIMPTPSAMLQAMTLLADGTKQEPGIGALMAVDVGGATTDVYSIAEGAPENMNILFKGFHEPYAKRTVEGDIGMRYSLDGIVEAVGVDCLAEWSGLTEATVVRLSEQLMSAKETLPDREELVRMDLALARGAAEIGSLRHAGVLEEVYTTSGLAHVQCGKDLRTVRQLVLTGGSLIHAADPLAVASAMLSDSRHPTSLRPLECKVWRDSDYILSAMGVLSTREPDIALRIMKRELEEVGRVRSDRSENKPTNRDENV